MKTIINQKIKKSLSCILILLIFINCVGCIRTIPFTPLSPPDYLKRDLEDFSEGDEIIVMTWDKETHSLTVVKIEESEIHGNVFTADHESTPIVIRAENIKSIHVKKNYTWHVALITVLIGGAAIFALSINWGHTGTIWFLR